LMHTRRSETLATTLFGATSGSAFYARATAALSLTLLGRFDEAVELQQRDIATFEQAYGRDSDALASMLDNHGFTLVQVGRTSEGAALLAIGKPAQARDQLEKAWKLATTRIAPPGVVANIQYQLARALVASGGDRERARQLAGKAHDELVRYAFKASLLKEVD